MKSFMNQGKRGQGICFVLILFFASSAFSRAATNVTATMALNDFGFELLRSVSKAAPQQNVLISPASLAINLALAQQGASASAEQEFSRALNLSGKTKAEIADIAKALRSRLLASLPAARAKKDAALSLELADSIWVDQRGGAKSAFLDSLRALGADAFLVNFNGGAACEQMNRWVSEKTHKKIPTVACPQVSGTDGRPLVLLDAVYFHDDWLTKFQREATAPAEFFGSTTTRPAFMHVEMKVRYARTNGHHHVSLEYASGQFAMDVIFSDRKKTLDPVLADANSLWFAKSILAQKVERLDFHFPKFEFRDRQSLKPTLEALALHRALAIDGMDGVGPRAYISDVSQQTWIKVDEEGTTAAAVSETLMMMGGGEIYFPLICDRPFLFTIRHVPTGLFLFLGSVWALPDATK
jgi:serpin B